jgi:hypothetical protein
MPSMHIIQSSGPNAMPTFLTLFSLHFPYLKYYSVGSTCVNLLLPMEISGRVMVVWEAPHG